MKKILLTLTTVALLAASARTASAGDREWATAGKILTGVFAGAVLARTFEPVPTYTYAPAVYYSPPVVQAPPTVYYQPAPVIVYSQPVYVQQVPVYVRPAPVYYQSSRVVGVHLGFGRRYQPPPVYRICR